MRASGREIVFLCSISGGHNYIVLKREINIVLKYNTIYNLGLI